MLHRPHLEWNTVFSFLIVLPNACVSLFLATLHTPSGLFLISVRLNPRVYFQMCPRVRVGVADLDYMVCVLPTAYFSRAIT